MTIDEDYVSYELAKKLKECGFGDPCDSYYIKDNAPDGTAWIVPTTYREDFNADYDCPFCKPLCSAPTLAHAQKWLREKKHLSVEPYANIVANFNYNIADLESFADYKGLGIGYASYECALAAGISASLELIKKGE